MTKSERSFPWQALTTSFSDHEIFGSALTAPVGTEINTTAWIPTPVKCEPADATGLMFQAWDNFDPRDQSKHTRLRANIFEEATAHGLYLLMLNAGEYEDALRYLQELVGGQVPFIPIKKKSS